MANSAKFWHCLPKRTWQFIKFHWPVNEFPKSIECDRIIFRHNWFTTWRVEVNLNWIPTCRWCESQVGGSPCRNARSRRATQTAQTSTSHEQILGSWKYSRCTPLACTANLQFSRNMSIEHQFIWNYFCFEIFKILPERNWRFNDIHLTSFKVVSSTRSFLSQNYRLWGVESYSTGIQLNWRKLNYLKKKKEWTSLRVDTAANEVVVND